MQNLYGETLLRNIKSNKWIGRQYKVDESLQTGL